MHLELYLLAARKRQIRKSIFQYFILHGKGMEKKIKMYFLILNEMKMKKIKDNKYKQSTLKTANHKVGS